jgi:hypothetical protein
MHPMCFQSLKTQSDALREGGTVTCVLSVECFPNTNIQYSTLKRGAKAKILAHPCFSKKVKKNESVVSIGQFSHD